MASKNGRENPDPAFQFYYGDFWASPKVQCMTPEEGWVYLRLLSECYRQQGLPMEMAELEIIAMSAKMAKDSFAIAWDRILSMCFVEREGRYWNPRTLREFEHRNEFKAGKSEAGKKGAEKRWGKKNAPNGGKKAGPHSKAMANDRSATKCHDSKMANDSPQPNPTHPNPSQVKGLVPKPSAPASPGLGLEKAKVKKPRVNGKEELANAMAKLGDHLGHPVPMDLVAACEEYRQTRVENRWPVWKVKNWGLALKGAEFDGEFDAEVMRVALMAAVEAPYRKPYPKKPTQTKPSSRENLMRGIQLGMDPNYGSSV